MIADRDGRWREAFEPSEESRRRFCWRINRGLGLLSSPKAARPPAFRGHVRHVERCMRVSSGRSRFSQTSSSRLVGRQFDDPAYPQVPRIEAGIGLGDPIPKPCAPVDSRSDGPQRVTGHNLVSFAAAASGDPRLRARRQLGDLRRRLRRGLSLVQSRR